MLSTPTHLQRTASPSLKPKSVAAVGVDMTWFRKPLMKPLVPASPEGTTRQLLVSCLDAADNLLPKIKGAVSTANGRRLAEIDIATLEARAVTTKTLYENAITIGQLSEAEQRAAKESCAAADRYVAYRIREARKWLKQLQ